jgi:hypothetical protein
LHWRAWRGVGCHFDDDNNHIKFLSNVGYCEDRSEIVNLASVNFRNVEAKLFNLNMVFIIPLRFS